MTSIRKQLGLDYLRGSEEVEKPPDSQVPPFSTTR
jgi:hypothetical protein